MMDAELIKDLANGSTIWGLYEARECRILHAEHPDWITLITDMDELEHITGQKFPGEKTLPYFGAILTYEGKKNLCGGA